jgi:predicted metal-dependent HD superfamily phosphohydrolase
MTLLEKAKEFVGKLLKDNLSISFTYHNFNHTLNVVEAATILAKSEVLNETDTEVLLIAAWFHDTGYTKGCTNHEQSSIAIVSQFLKDNDKEQVFIDAVAKVIEATIYDRSPRTQLEKIIKDADYSHFAREDYLTLCEKLRKEWEVTSQKFYSDLEWAKENLHIISQFHVYYTQYALENWQPIKEKNIQLIQNKINDDVVTGTVATKETEDKKKKKKKSKKLKTSRGVDTLFRITLSNHTRLSGIADSKANILLSVNAVIISIALSSIIPKLDSPSNSYLIIPTFIMLMFSVISIIFAILSTRPKVTTGTFTRQDIEDKKVNLLFFGNFFKMPLEEYEWAVNEMMKDDKYLYNSMIKDLYFLGLVLEKKYSLLRITYNIFMLGIIVSVISFVIAFNSIHA